jgi:dipicolinate synthase subunit A
MPSGNINVLMIGGDRRNIYLHELLRRKENIDLHAFGLAVADKGLADVEKATNEADIVILPMPSVKNGMVPLLSMEAAYPLDTLLQNMREGATLVGGFLQGAPGKAGVTVVNLLSSERFQQANAWPTAEGAICIALKRSERTLKGSRCAVLGYGRIGKDLVKLLGSFGAEVVATARRPEQLEDIRALGVLAVHTNDLAEACGDCNFIFNTIPCVLLDEDKLRKLRRDVVIIDLASVPFGVDFNAATRLKLDAQTYQSLPGRMFPKSAADIIYNCIKDLFT